MRVCHQEEPPLPPRIRQLRMTAQRTVAGGTLRGREGHDTKCAASPGPQRIFGRRCSRRPRVRYDLSPDADDVPPEAAAGALLAAGVLLAGAVVLDDAAGVEAEDDEAPPPSFLVEP